MCWLAPISKKKFSIPIYLHSEDLPLYDSVDKQGMLFGVKTPRLPAVDHEVEDSQKLNLAGLKITVVHTPGHSPGSVTYSISGDKRYLFVGDTLFAGSIGRN
jgi:hydroxyacylglutathione hydrolase